MKYSILFILFTFLASHAEGQSTLSLDDFGKPELLLVNKKNRMSSFPSYFEETDSVKYFEAEGEKVRIIYFSYFSDRVKKTPGGFNRLSEKGDVISWVRNDTLSSRISRNGEGAKGVIAGKTGTVKKRFLPRLSSNLPAAELYSLEEDSTHYLVYKPEFNLIELESGTFYERRYLFGDLFNSILSASELLRPTAPMNTKLAEGDEMEIVFSARKLQAEKKEFIYEPVHLMRVQIKKGLLEGDLLFESYLIDLQSTTIFGRRKGPFMVSEGYCITDEQVFISDTSYSPVFRILPVNSEIRPHPLIPLIELSGPQLEGMWIETGKNIPQINTIHYWNSLDYSRISYANEFPFPWKDAGDGYSGDIQYINTKDFSLGKSYKIASNRDLHFEEVAFSNDSLELSIWSPGKKNIQIHFESGAEKDLLIKEYKVLKGITPLKVSLNDLRAGASGYLVISELKGKEKIEMQRFKLSQTQ